MVEIVTTRLGQLYEADDPKQQMGLDVPSIFDVYTYRWGKTILGNAEDGSETKKLYRRISEYLKRRGVVTTPLGGFSSFIKPCVYLALALTYQGMTWIRLKQESPVNASN